MSWVTLALLGGWLVAAYIAQRQYVLNLQDSIHNYRLDAERAIDDRAWIAPPRTCWRNS